MAGEETSISEKIIKLFTHENFGIWFKNYNIIIEVDEGNHGNYDSDDEKERKFMFKNHFFDEIQMILTLIFLNFSGKINLYVSKLHEKKML